MDGHRRSSRSRKKVSYSKFSESSDDDFAEENASVTKKKKKSDHREKKTFESDRNKPERKRKEVKNPSSDVQPRPSVVEKVFQRHLEMAIKLSGKDDVPEENLGVRTRKMLQYENVTSTSRKKRKDRPTSSEKPILHKDVKVSLQAIQKEEKPKKESENEANSEDDDKDGVTEEQEEDICKTKPSNRAVKKESKGEADMEEDDDYTVSDEEEEEDDQEEWKESSDESEDKRRKSSRKPQSKAKKEEKSVQNKLKPAARQAKRQDSQNHSTPKGKVINYCSKQPLNLPAVKLRLGLSRKAVTKPLHPVVKSTTVKQ